MKTKSKALLLALCAVLLVVASVMGTLAYLTYTTDTVVNTFTVGKVQIKLDEADVDENGEYLYVVGTDEDGKDILGTKDHDSYTNSSELADRVIANEYHLLPSQDYVKDPMVTVLAGSEESYVRMIVTVKNVDQLKLALPHGDLVAIEENAKYYNDGKFLIQYLVDGWDNTVWKTTGVIEESSDKKTATYEFWYVGTENKGTKDGTVAKVTSDTALDPLFTSIIVPTNVDNTTLAYLDKVEINVVAHAIQSAGFNSAADAWAEWNN